MLKIIFDVCSIFFTALIFIFSIPVVVIIFRIEIASPRLLKWLLVWGSTGIASAGFRIAAMIINNETVYSFTDWLFPILGLIIGAGGILLHRIVCYAQRQNEVPAPDLSISDSVKHHHSNKSA